MTVLTGSLSLLNLLGNISKVDNISISKSHLPLPTPQLSSGGDPGQGGHHHLVWDVRQAAPPRQAVRKDKDVESGLVSLIFRSSKNDQKFNPSSRNAKKIGNISNQVGVWGIKVRMEFPFNFSSFLF